MISKFQMRNLRNSEHFQFISSACAIFGKYNIDTENLGPLYDELNGYLRAEETGLAFERENEKIAEKNRMDAYRDKLHGKLFNQLKSILYDEKDPRFDAAQRVMKVVKEVGNPTRLAENAESAMLTTLGNRMEAHSLDMDAAGVRGIVENLIDTNRQFIQLEKECREISAALKNTKAPSMSETRRQADPVYTSIVNAINGYAGLPAKKDAYKDIVSELNTLVEKYDNLLAQRKGGKGDKK